MGRFGLHWSIHGSTVPWALVHWHWHWAVLGSIGKFLAVLGIIGQLWARQYLAVLGRTRLYLALVGSTVKYWAVGVGMLPPS